VAGLNPTHLILHIPTRGGKRKKRKKNHKCEIKVFKKCKSPKYP
jgi:hypothetical protein